MVENSSVAQKHTSGEAPKVCSVCTITCSQAMLVAVATTWPSQSERNPRHVWSPRPSEPEACTQPARVVLVDASVYLKPTELLNVALDMLARLTPCLNLRVGELGYKDLLDTISADNCRK